MALIEIRDTDTGYHENQPVLQQISLDIHRGEKIALVGASGAGKSTLIKLLYRQLMDERVTLVPQDLGLVPTLPVFHNVYIGRLNQYGLWHNLRNFLVPAKDPVAEICSILDQLGIEDYLYTPVMQLSGGQRQRVAIARAIYNNGEILLADEPVSAVDGLRADKVMELIGEQWETAIVALHDIGLARSFANRIVGIKDGRIALDGACSDITAAHLSQVYQ